jgi:hypothetical protein
LVTKTDWTCSTNQMTGLFRQWDDSILYPSTNKKLGKRANQKAGYKKNTAFYLS